MDNNVVASPRLNEIIDEIIDLGFQRGEKMKNPKTGFDINRRVDFNRPEFLDMLKRSRQYISRM